jgi:hypothetical protein
MNQAALLLGFWLVAANGIAAPVVALAHIEPPRWDQDLPMAVFGGTERKIDVGIGGVDLKQAALHGDLFQVAGRLAMPLEKSVEIPSPTDLPGDARVTVFFPEVKSQTGILLRLSAANPAGGAALTLGEIRFAVFPRELTSQIISLLSPLPNGDNRLVVFGLGRKLRPSLQALHIPFEDSGDDLPGRFAPERIYLGDIATRDEQQQAHDRSQGARVALFSSDDSLLPGLFSNQGADGIFILVTLPVLDALPDNPRAQLVLLKIIQSLTST